MSPLAQTATFYLGGFAAALMSYIRYDIEDAPNRSRLRLTVSVAVSLILAAVWPINQVWRLLRASLGYKRRIADDVVPAATQREDG